MNALEEVAQNRRKPGPIITPLIAPKVERKQVTHTLVPQKGVIRQNCKLDEFHQKMGANHTISREERDLLLSRMPKLHKDEMAKRFILGLAGGFYPRDRDTGFIRAGYRDLGFQLGCDPKKGNKMDFLVYMQENYLPYLQVRDYYHQGNKTRLIINTGLKELVQEKLSENAREKERVYALTGKKVTKTSQKRNRKELKEIASQFTWENECQKVISDHFLTVKDSVYECSPSRYDKLFLEAQENQDEKLFWFLQRHLDDPVTRYMPVREKKDTRGITPRLYGNLLQYTPRRFRRKMYPHWLDLDIRHCQLSEVAALFGITTLQDYLNTDECIWNRLTIYLGLPLEAKVYVKRAVYSIIYGMKERKVNKKLKEALEKNLGIKLRKNITSEPLMKDLVIGIENAKKEIIKNDGMQGAFGWEKLGNIEINSFLACVIQSFEIALIFPCYELLLKQKKHGNDTFNIVLHQHDGISICLKKGADKEKVIAQLQKAVLEGGKRFGMTAILEEKKGTDDFDFDVEEFLDEEEQERAEQEEREEEDSSYSLYPRPQNQVETNGEDDADQNETERFSVKKSKVAVKKAYETYVFQSGKHKGLSLLDAYRLEKPFLISTARCSPWKKMRDMARELLHDKDGTSYDLSDVPK